MGFTITYWIERSIWETKGIFQMKLFTRKNSVERHTAKPIISSLIVIGACIGLIGVASKTQPQTVENDTDTVITESTVEPTGVLLPLDELSFDELKNVTTSNTTTTVKTTSTSSNTSTMDTTTMNETSIVTATEEIVTYTEPIETTIETVVSDIVTTVVEVVNEEPREYVVYKPSTHYVHRNTCHWYTNECYEITSTEGLECRYCTECNPDIEIVTPYQEPTYTNPAPQQTVNTSGHAALNYVTEEERIYLCNTVAQEYGSDWVSLYDKGCVVAAVMNRVRDGGWSNGLPSTVYNVLTAPYQFDPSYAVPYYRWNVTQSCIDAVDYYFENMDLFPNYHSFYGDGRYNYFS
jgi:hypothetical protein